MRYKILIFGIIFFVSVLVLMEASKTFQAKILGMSDYIKIAFLDFKESIHNAYQRHFNQAQQIEALKAKMIDYDRIVFEKEILKNDIIKLQRLMGSGGITYGSSEIHQARIISFVTMGERDSVWLDSNLSYYHQNVRLEDRIFGIVKDNVAFGVAVFENGRLEGFLNGNKNCHYDVYIGKNKVMGIVSGSHNGQMFIEYIPNWVEIHEGDEVFTSGLDGIFLENIPVGVVENIRENYGYLSASVKPYATMSELSYVWIIDRETPQLLTNDGELDNEQSIQQK